MPVELYTAEVELLTHRNTRRDIYGWPADVVLCKLALRALAVAGRDSWIVLATSLDTVSLD
jgi:hypothetical protein